MKRNIEEQNSLRLPELLGVPKKGIIFSDLDGVWFDENNNFASPPPSDLRAVQQAKNAGYLMVLVSDTGASALASFSEQLQFDSVVVAENGAVVYLPNQGMKTFLTPSKSFFDEFNQRAINLFYQDENTEVIIGDATSLIKEDSLLSKPGKTMLVINGARECSFGVYTRSVNSIGKLTIDDNITKITEQRLKELLESAPQTIDCKRYPAIGSCLVKDREIVKSKAVKWIIDQFPSTLSYYMIGDTLNDSMDSLGKRVITCAVGNADNNLKAIAEQNNGIIAPDNMIISSGANYILTKIIEGGVR